MKALGYALVALTLPLQLTAVALIALSTLLHTRRNPPKE